MASTYWRVSVSAVGGLVLGSDYCALAEIKFYYTDAGVVSPVPITGGTATASSIFNGSYPASHAFNNTPTDYWVTIANGVPAWIQYQFPTAVEVNGVLLMSGPSSANTPWHTAPKDFKLQSSNNGTDWTDVLTYSGVNWDTSGNHERYFNISFPSKVLLPPPARRDTADGGPYRIIEIVTEMLSPQGGRRVRLCDQISGRCVREQWSDPVTGEVDFQYIRQGPWVLYALDHTEAPTFEAEAISDRMATLDGSRP